MHEDVGVPDVDETEEELADQLRELCYLNGKEKDPKLSAPIFHKLALIYMKKSPDKISLIQSAALFNAAMVRCPDNFMDVQKDLEVLCLTVLKSAGVMTGDVDLVAVAKTCKKAVEQFREDTNIKISSISFVPENLEKSKLHKLEKKIISQIKNLQNFITEKYLEIMGNLSGYCLKIMGEPPSHCRFALVGMGSLARKEITPYSDFENVIVLEEESQLKENYCEIIEYFRWFSVIFQIILVNMGETIVPSISIPCLNDFSTPGGDWFFDAYTPSGISFDGLMPYACKMPLGRRASTRSKSVDTELIKPASAMANILDADQRLKHGHHLADVLSRTCFVSGDRRVYEDFAQKTTRKLSLHRKKNEKFAIEIRKQVQDDRLKFDVNTNMTDMFMTSKFNLKRVIYRSTTIFISALGTYYGIESSSCFDILEKLQEKEIISNQQRHYLQYAVAIACEIRLKIYMNRKRQSDWIENRTLGNELTDMLSVVGGQCIVDYFTVARALQDEITSMEFNEPNKPKKLNLVLDFKYSVDICCKLRLHKTCIRLCTNLLQNEKRSLSPEETASCHYYAGMSCFDLEDFKEARKHFTKELHLRQKENKRSNSLLADCLYNLGRCCSAISHFDQALTFFKQEYKIREEITNNKPEDQDVAFCLREIAKCLLHLKQVDMALEKFHIVLKIWEGLGSDRANMIQIISSKYDVGTCLIKKQDYEGALNLFADELQLRKRLSSDENTDCYVADCLYRIGSCLMNLERHEDAISRFNEARDIFENLKMNKMSQKVGHALCVHGADVCKNILEGGLPSSHEVVIQPNGEPLHRPPRDHSESIKRRQVSNDVGM